ncbi:PTS sugar transporter subunit IIB, partial [Escherichia coli]|nr:PTS sugar transporter subunit IIB [Escherichia coli]
MRAEATSVDNRLVHGQVGVTWTSTIGANLLVRGRSGSSPS